ncbi:hypothetical protein UlMin_032139 [Ulmus minor]
MATSKSKYHIRSNSFPTRPHPLFNQCDEQLCRLVASEASSSSTISSKLSGLEDLHGCVDKLLLLPLTQQALVRGRQEKWVEQVLDGSLRVLDVCSSAKDSVIHTKECAREIQSIMRRRRGGEDELACEVKKYSASRKVVKKAIQKALGNLKGVETKSLASLADHDNETKALFEVLREVEAVTLSVFESLLCFVSGPKAQSKLAGWSLVSKLVHHKKVGCDKEETESNEFAKVDAALLYLMAHDTIKSDQTKHVERVRGELQNLELCVQDFEERLERLFRRLIRTRVAILNIINN